MACWRKARTGEGSLPRAFPATGRAALSALALVLLLAPGPAAAGAASTGVAGRVVFAGKGVAGAFVEAFDRPPGASSPVASTNSGADGSFRLDLPSGVYFLTARKPPSPASSMGMLYGTSGPGGIAVAKGAASAVEIVLADRGSGGTASGEGVHVSGRALLEGRPVDGCFAYFYPGESRRGPGYDVRVRCGEDGRFEASLPPGRYTVAVRQAGAEEGIGSARAGDLVGDHPGNPVPIQGRSVDLGTIPLRRLDASLLEERQWGAAAGGAVRLEGRVTDEAGRPVRGVYAFLYADHRMVGKPAAISAPSGADGRFELVAPAPGTFYLGGRSRFGGPVEPGESMGAYGGQTPQPLEVGPGTRQGLDFVVREVW